ncbi:MAG: 30S ribosomal protein S17e [Candidatus Altiarchaeota archaeon]
MGSIKHTYIKRIANKLLEDHKSEFNKDFELNKKKVNEYTTVKGKTIRNRIAGYITRVLSTESA